MTKNRLSYTGETTLHTQKLTPNEKAIIDRVRIPALRKVVVKIWQLKLRLQFTGWLQYTIPTIIALAFVLITALAFLLGFVQVAMICSVVALLLLALVIVDLVTVKFRLRFPERLPKRRDELDLFDLMRARESCRSFQTQELTPADRDELLGYVQLHSEASTIGKFPIRFEYIAAPLTVWPTVNASEFLVAIAPKAYRRLAVIDVGRSLQKIVMEATRMGLGTCWIGPGADQTSIRQHLGDRFDPQEDHITCVCAVGYKSRHVPLFIRIFNAQMHRRLPLTSLFFADDHFDEPLDLAAYPFNLFGRTYEICQWAPSSYNGQTTRCVAVLEQNGTDAGKSAEHKPHLARFDFYAVTASRYYAAVAVGIWCANWELGCEAVGIRGHFAVLSTREQGIDEAQAPTQLPRYDVSWLLDESF